MNKKGFFTMGAAMLLTVLLVLILVSFSLLRLSTARSAYFYAEGLRHRSQVYYTAHSLAEETVAKVLSSEDTPVPVEQDGHTFSFAVSMEDGQVLRVRCTQEGEVLVWQVENTD